MTLSKEERQKIREENFEYVASIAKKCSERGIDPEKALGYFYLFKKTVMLLGVVKTQKEAIECWNTLHDIQREAKSVLETVMFKGTIEQLIKAKREQMPLIYDACLKWGLIHE